MGEEGNGKPHYKIHFPRNKLRTLSLVSAKLEIKYAMHYLQLSNGNSDNHRFHSAFHCNFVTLSLEFPICDSCILSQKLCDHCIANSNNEDNI